MRLQEPILWKSICRASPVGSVQKKIVDKDLGSNYIQQYIVCDLD
jgi:hypothetical protein